MLTQIKYVANAPNLNFGSAYDNLFVNKDIKNCKLENCEIYEFKFGVCNKEQRTFENIFFGPHPDYNLTAI